MEWILMAIIVVSTGVVLYCSHKIAYHRGYIEGFKKCDILDEKYIKAADEKLSDAVKIAMRCCEMLEEAKKLKGEL